MTNLARFTVPAIRSLSDADYSAGLDCRAAALLDLAKAAKLLDEATAALVADARAAGDSWQLIGGALGITKQGAQQRFGQ